MAQYKSRYTGKEIDERLERAGSVSNPNLLDNWYFGNPVNQRGQPSYTGVGYGIDRWSVYGYTSGAIALTHDGINISGSFDFGTVIEMSRMPDDSPITASFLFTDGFYSFTVANKHTFGAAQLDSGGAQCVWLPNWPTADSGTGLFFVNGNLLPSINRTLVAVKFELGSQQTLAHQENGVWVLNEVADYSEQLAKCQRYYQRLSSAGNDLITGNIAINGLRISTTQVQFLIPIPVSMRANPTAQFSGSLAVLDINASKVINITSVTCAGAYNQNFILMTATVGESITGTDYALRLLTTGLAFSADL